MKYALRVVVFPVAVVIGAFTVIVLAALFAVHAAFGYDEPMIDE